MAARLKTGIAFSVLFFCVVLSARDVFNGSSIPTDLLYAFMTTSVIAGVSFVNVVVGVKSLLTPSDDSEA